jgi:hypothetical protein
MYSAPRPEPIDIRLVFRAYAILAGLRGFVLAGWGPVWLGTTVKTHVGNVLSKLQVENQSQVIVQALKRGLVCLDELD